MIYRLFFTLLPPVIMAGCEILALAAVETAVVGVGTVIESQIDSEVYEESLPVLPYIFHSTSDTIAIFYGADSESQREEAFRLVREHCHGSFVAEQQTVSHTIKLDAKCQ